MYRALFNLKAKPFEITADPSFLWFGGKYTEALATLRYGILENKGFLLMTGDAGTGKTTLINALTESLGDTVKWAVISDPKRERLDFYNAIAQNFGITREFTSKVQFLIQFSQFLHKSDEEQKKVVLLIDNCHLLSQEMLEELRLLSNIEKTDTKLINIFFVGQRHFNDTLIQPNNRAVRQRLALKIDLPALTAAETAEYINHRLKIAGTGKNLFTPKATNIIHRYSFGIPKRINIICDHALVVAGVQGKQSVDHLVVEECVKKLNLPFQPSQEDFEGLDDEKSHLEHFRGRFTPGSAVKPTAVMGINLENNGRFRWLKYSLGGAALALAAVYFFHPGDRAPEIVGGIAQKAEQPHGVREMPLVMSSPAITVLEQNQDGMNVKKAAELKNAILEKAYSNNTSDNARQGAAGEFPPEDAVETDVGRTALRTAKDIEAKNVVADQKVPALVANGEKPSDQKATPLVAVEAVKDKGKVPELPMRIILPLAANSHKLTGEGLRDYNRFVEKLKMYPHAKLLVKGFVSSKTESPENTRLSEERALAVQTMLVSSGIETARMQAKGLGNQEPIASNDTSEGRAKNRRVEILVIENGL